MWKLSSACERHGAAWRNAYRRNAKPLPEELRIRNRRRRICLAVVPRGTHSWSQFVTPQELAKALRAAGLHIKDETGVIYDPIAAKWRLSHDMDVNYIMAANRPV